MIKTKPGETVHALIAMQQTNTNKNALDLSLHQRKCLFEEEVTMKYFADEPYTITGCLKECKLDQAMKICGCLPPFYWPSQLSNATYCDFQSLKCLKDEKVWKVDQCRQCELSCDYTTFSVENLKTALTGSNENASLTKNNQKSAKVVIGLMQWPVLSFQREVRFGFVDFLVAFGSIMALFLSFSLLSAIELLLYVIRFLATKICPPKEGVSKA